jgi:hypothetical protein
MDRGGHPRLEGQAQLQNAAERGISYSPKWVMCSSDESMLYCVELKDTHKKFHTFNVYHWMSLTICIYPSLPSPKISFCSCLCF